MLWEFREYFDLQDDRFTARLFRCFDEDCDNRISFLEFTVGLWTYCELRPTRRANERDDAGRWGSCSRSSQ